MNLRKQGWTCVGGSQVGIPTLVPTLVFDAWSSWSLLKQVGEPGGTRVRTLLRRVIKKLEIERSVGDWVGVLVKSEIPQCLVEIKEAPSSPFRFDYAPLASPVGDLESHPGENRRTQLDQRRAVCSTLRSHPRATCANHTTTTSTAPPELQRTAARIGNRGNT